ncbi:hypothetical protein K504DRAFT_439169 [Pleomassaria siparia CBS 279.74]|uniref:Mmc1 C-terminal domain-containing protein n=1 Tax=Pleomassaria siparia CBS 279.74 TaxID=1314801 RepID=A0A6G1K087_9PLEO|nr:hypothetical protein K504DRAFT_439169 [Pleomassaria siparia CBS 279.74]
MPPWVAFVPRSTSLLKGRGIERLPLAIHCRNVAIPRVSRCSHLRIRSASTHVSPTAINAQPRIPPRNKELHDAISDLSGDAGAFVNISRLQLALQGLAVQDAVVRIAVLSLGNQRIAQQLARLLLADPLGAEEQWERDLDKTGDEGRPILLRYGDEGDTHPSSPLYRILSIPSRVLQTHRLEVLISTLNTRVPTANRSAADALVVPILPVTSATTSIVPYPVHKTLVLGDGLDSAVEYGKFTWDVVGDMPDMVKAAVDLPPPMKEMESEKHSTCAAVNIEAGTAALASFRLSIANATIYEQGWFKSGMPILSEWLVQGMNSSETPKPALKRLVESLVDDAENRITEADTAELNHLVTAALHPDVTQSILDHLETWAEKSHAELRDELDEAFSARNWHKLAWWKLLWRADDVGVITSEILERRWLVSAEKSCIFLAGRMDQAGFPDDVRKLSIPLQQETPSSTLSDQASPTTPEPPTSGEAATNVSTVVHAPQPWPAQIAASRSELSRITIPHLQSLSQRLVLAALSTTSISSALSALLYISVPTFSAFEASAIAAVGLTFSLRRLQNMWEKARETWQAEVREEGRKTLKSTEETVRLIVSRSQKPVADSAGVEQRRTAREAVKKVRDALARV